MNSIRFYLSRLYPAFKPIRLSKLYKKGIEKEKLLYLILFLIVAGALIYITFGVLFKATPWA